MIYSILWRAVALFDVVSMVALIAVGLLAGLRGSRFAGYGGALAPMQARVVVIRGGALRLRPFPLRGPCSRPASYSSS